MVNGECRGCECPPPPENVASLYHPEYIRGGIARRPPKTHTPECLARRGRLGAARETARGAADELQARFGPDAKRDCPECGGVMVPMRAGEGFRN